MKSSCKAQTFARFDLVMTIKRILLSLSLAGKGMFDLRQGQSIVTTGPRSKEDRGMDHLLSYLQTRRSVSARFLTGPAPSQAEIDTMVSIAARVPDHGKLAPWRFIVIKDEARQDLGHVMAGLAQHKQSIIDPERLEVEKNRFCHAPLVIAVISKAADHPKIPLWEQQLSAGAVCMNLLSAASALGYGACWLTEWMAYDRDFCSALGLTEHEQVAGFIHIGHVSQKPVDRPRPALSEIMTTWSADKTG